MPQQKGQSSLNFLLKYQSKKEKLSVIVLCFVINLLVFIPSKNKSLNFNKNNFNLMTSNILTQKRLLYNNVQSNLKLPGSRCKLEGILQLDFKLKIHLTLVKTQ